MKAINREQLQVTYSSSRDLPIIQVLQNACDCHHHIYDPTRYPYVLSDVRNQPPARVEEYKILQEKYQFRRSVIVQPSAYGLDNSCTLDALKQMGGQAKAVVVVDNTIEEETLSRWNELGVRGVRFNIATGGTSNLDVIKEVADRIYDFGWHLQFWMTADTTLELSDFLKSLKNEIVFDHRGHLPKSVGITHPAFKVIKALLESGKAWVKLSGLYIDHDDAYPDYQDTVSVGKAYVAINPDRMLWGTDWPHPSVFNSTRAYPNDAYMLDLLLEQAGDEKTLNKILADNPERLYRF
ncbi:amidohydrolase family protein [Veillonella ratti]|uniref:amidohydrolase family protein n=1 Tax=Veillonella ratti TaxID=103892 RepID=UPI000F8CE39B|nr:amidohydrolase family protein [Veillonella ratti]